MPLTSLYRFAVCGAALVAALSALEAGAAPVMIAGQLGIVHSDTGGGIYAGATSGTSFLGAIDDVTASGSISDGVSLTVFACCIAAGGLEVSNDVMLDAEQATLLNTLLGVAQFSAGDTVDEVTLEGDAETAGMGRIEVGVSWVLAAGAFADENPSNYPFDPAHLLVALFFVAEFDAGNAEIFNATGILAPVPLPAAGWLLGLGALAVARRGRRPQRAFGP